MRGSLAGSKVLCRLVVLAAAIAAGTEAPSPFPKFPPPPPHLAPLLPTHPNPTQPNPISQTQNPNPNSPPFNSLSYLHNHIQTPISLSVCLPLSVFVCPDSKFQIPADSPISTSNPHSASLPAHKSVNHSSIGTHTFTYMYAAGKPFSNFLQLGTKYIYSTRESIVPSSCQSVHTLLTRMGRKHDDFAKLHIPANLVLKN